MKKVLKIEGMMCPHCENKMKKALEAVEGVDSALVSHAEGTAIVSFEAVSDETLAETVKKSGYTLVSIEDKGE